MPGTCGSSSLIKHVCFFLDIRKSYNTYCTNIYFRAVKDVFLTHATHTKGNVLGKDA